MTGKQSQEAPSRKLTKEERDEIVNDVYNRFYSQVGSSAIRALLYIVWAAALYVAFKLTSEGWIRLGS